MIREYTIEYCMECKKGNIPILIDGTHVQRNEKKIY